MFKSDVQPKQTKLSLSYWNCSCNGFEHCCLTCFFIWFCYCTMSMHHSICPCLYMYLVCVSSSNPACVLDTHLWLTNLYESRVQWSCCVNYTLLYGNILFYYGIQEYEIPRIFRVGVLSLECGNIVFIRAVNEVVEYKEVFHVFFFFLIDSSQKLHKKHAACEPRTSMHGVRSGGRTLDHGECRLGQRLSYNIYTFRVSISTFPCHLG